MTIREQTQAIEAQILSPGAMLSVNTRGRLTPEPECEIRTCFARDRDRIIHCNSFRRLKYKTQVFLRPTGDHYRTRLTHTLEVSQIARTISTALRLNGDLTEAVALGHDLGHTPFGHAGERALNDIAPMEFNHFAQSVRVVDVLEKNGEGLNLTWEVRNGILCHTRGPVADTLEGQVVRFADRIAYMNHDIDDAIRAGVMTEADIPWDVKYVLGTSKSQRISALIENVIQSSADIIRMDGEIRKAFDNLHRFLYDFLYTNPEVKGEEAKAEDLVKRLYEYFYKNPDLLPEEYEHIYQREGIAQAACDYIAGMTDRYAIDLFNQIHIPKGWSRI